MKDNSKKVLKFLQEHDGEKLTLDVIAAGVDLTARQVNGCVVGLQKETDKKPAYAVRTPGKIQLEDGTTKEVKFISLTPAGLSLNPDAEDAE